MFSRYLFWSMVLLSSYCYLSLLYCAELASVYCMMMVGAVFSSVVLGSSSYSIKPPMKGMLSYLMVQVLGSNFILAGLSFSEGVLGSYLTFAGFVLKVGLFPFHYWVYYVFSQLSWSSFVPGVVLFKAGLVGSLPLSVSSTLLVVVLVLTFLQGVIGVFSEGSSGSLKGVVAWVSVSDGGWSLLSKMMSFNLFLWYVLMSGFIVGSLVLVLSSEEIEGVGEMANCGKPLSIIIGLLSYGGMPPFLGCVMKLYIFSGALEFGDVCFFLAGLSGLTASVLMVACILNFASSCGLKQWLWQDKELSGVEKLLIGVSMGGLLFLFF